MPVPTSSQARTRRDSWPPTQVRLQPRVVPGGATPEDMDLSHLDEDPLTYFLTPAPVLDDGDMDEDVDMDFDAGIEDAKHPPHIVRSVSPSSLDGLSRPSARPPTPPRSPPSRLSPDRDTDISSAEEDDDHEEFFRFPPGGRSHPFGLHFSLKDLATGRGKAGTHIIRNSPVSDAPSRPASAPIMAASTRGRTSRRLGPRPLGAMSGSVHGQTRSFSASRSPPHAWREPSPDVWSIEEETEEELNSGVGGSEMMDMASEDEKADTGKEIQASLDIPAAKPKKRVRFVLPAKNE